MTVYDPASAAGSIGLAVASIFGLLNCECSDPRGPGTEPEDKVKEAEVDSVLNASEQAAQQRAEEMAADAAARDKLVDEVLTGKGRQLADEAKNIRDEMDDYNRQWQEAQQGIDRNDPGYDKIKQQYDDYQKYLREKLDDVNSQMNEIEATRLQEQAARESQNEWIKQRQQDLIQVAEQKSYLEAVAKGYGAKEGYDIDAVEARLKQLSEREAELRQTLKDNDAEIDYTPREREPIGPDEDSVKLNEKYRAQKEALEKEAARAKAEANEARREEMAREQEILNKNMQEEAGKAAFWNFMTKAAETTQVAADVGVDILSMLTGPVGKEIKIGYSGLKGLGSGIGNAMTKDNLEDAAKELIKGSAGGVTDMGKDMIGDKFGDAAKNIFTVGSEAFKGGLEAGLDGKDVMDGAIGGGLKGGLDVGLSAGLDKLLPPGKMTENLDWSNVNTKGLISSIKSGNPLSMGNRALTEGMKNLGKDQVKNFVKGDEVPVLEWKQEFTGDFIQKVGTPMVKAGGKMLGEGASAVGG